MVKGYCWKNCSGGRPTSSSSYLMRNSRWRRSSSVVVCTTESSMWGRFDAGLSLTREQKMTLIMSEALRGSVWTNRLIRRAFAGQYGPCRFLARYAERPPHPAGHPLGKRAAPLDHRFELGQPSPELSQL